MRRLRALPCLLALLLAACAGSPSLLRVRLDGWHAAQMGETRVVGDVGPDELRSLAYALARFDAIFAKVVGWPAESVGNPVCVVLLRDRGTASRFGLGRGVAGWAFGTLEESFIAAMVPLGVDFDRVTLLHEYTHVLLRRNRRAPLPRWYHEGLATYFSTVSEHDGAVVVGAAPVTLAGRIARRGVLPLDRLFARPISGARYEEVADFYATSWALSHYLLSTPRGRRELTAFVRQLERGVESGEARRTAFGRSVGELERELALHVSGLLAGIPVETLIDAGAFATPEPPGVVALAPGEAALVAGTLALELADASDGSDEIGSAPQELARDLLAYAAGQRPSDARAQAALGVAAALGGDANQGRASVRDALARAPRDPVVRLRAGRVALLHAEAEDAASRASSLALADAESRYREALALDPESSAAWFGLGRTLVALGRSEEAFAAFERARGFGWSEALDVALARLHLARGEPELAAELLLPIAQEPHVGPTQREAAALLERTRR